MTESTVRTSLGTVRVRTVGVGPPAVLWHSLFVDRSSWARVEEPLSRERSLVIVESPGHGGSPAVGRDYTYDDLALAATEILDQLAISTPVDWLGSALGGHVGIVFAARFAERCRSLLTMGTPVHGLSSSERRQVQMLARAYPIVGPRPVTRPLMAALLGKGTRRSDPDAWSIAARSFQRANRRGMTEAVRCASLLRPDLNPLLSSVMAPTLFATGSADPMWSISDAGASAALLPHGAAVVLPSEGHIGALFHAPDAVVALATEFWRDPAPVVAKHRAR